MNNPQPQPLTTQKNPVSKVIGIIEDYARETSNSEIGVWTDGIGLYAIEDADIILHEGVKYKITIEEIL